MNYDTSGTVHSSYNVWVKELVDHLNLALSKAASAAALESRGVQPVAAAPAGAQEPGTPVEIYLVVTGSDRALATNSWERLRTHFSEQLTAANPGGKVVLLTGNSPPAGASGRLVVVYVLNYFFVSTWTRDMPIGGSRQATLNARVQVQDLATGTSIADNSYDKVSRASEGNYQEATEAQVRAMAGEIVEAARRPVAIAAPAPVVPTAAPVSTVKTFTAPSGPADRTEILFWESVRNSRSAGELEAYLQQYPNGTFAPLARERLKSLGHVPTSR
jgi:hypothetical protein